MEKLLIRLHDVKGSVAKIWSRKIWKFPFFFFSRRFIIWNLKRYIELLKGVLYLPHTSPCVYHWYFMPLSLTIFNNKILVIIIYLIVIFNQHLTLDHILLYVGIWAKSLLQSSNCYLSYVTYFIMNNVF